MIDLNSIVDNLECDDYLEDIDDLESFDEWISKWDDDSVILIIRDEDLE